MKKMRKIIWAGVVAAALGAGGAEAIEAYRMQPGEAVALDGKLDDPVWTRA